MFYQLNSYVRRRRLCTLIVLAVVLANPLCFASSQSKGSGKPPNPTPFPGVSFKIENATVPPGGTLQLQLFLTEPKPVGHGGSEITVSTALFGPVQGVALNDPTGRASGVAFFDGAGVQITVVSPDAMLGTNTTEYPLFTMNMPVRTDAPIGGQSPLNIHTGTSFWFDPTGQLYPQELQPGTMIVGGSLSITNVTPGGGLVPAGSTVVIKGMGFTPLERIDIEGVSLASTSFVSSTEIDVRLAQATQMAAKRVRIRNRDTNEEVRYFTYLHTATLGKSARAVFAAADPMFSQLTFATARIPWQQASSQLTGLALQNPTSSPDSVTLDLLSSSNQVLESLTFSLPGSTKITRDLLELFPQGPGAATTVRITSATPIQMLGMLADPTSNTVVPMAVSAP